MGDLIKRFAFHYKDWRLCFPLLRLCLVRYLNLIKSIIPMEVILHMGDGTLSRIAHLLNERFITVP